MSVGGRKQLNYERMAKHYDRTDDPFVVGLTDSDEVEAGAELRRSCVRQIELANRPQYS